MFFLPLNFAFVIRKIVVSLIMLAMAAAVQGKNRKHVPVHNSMHSQIQYLHALPSVFPFRLTADSLLPWVNPAELSLLRHEARMRGPLQESDYEEVAAQLGVEPAAIHAVIDIEAGVGHKGFWGEGTPVVNFSLANFKRFAAEKGINLKKYTKSHPQVFSKSAKGAAAVTERVRQAMDIDSVAAIKACYWGMFQIGGFNWKMCGTSSPQEFYEKMTHSERSQLDLFVEFLRSSSLLEPLRKKNWKAFAKGYNGPSYARRGYHKRLDRAYKKYAGKK